LLSAEVWLENDEPRSFQLRGASVLSTELRVAGDGTHAERVARIPVPRQVTAHQRRLLSVAFHLDRSTRPGTYQAAIVLEGDEDTQAFPARIIVTPHYELTIAPDELVFSAVPGATFGGEVIVSNHGNVPIEVFPLGEFPLEEPSRDVRCCCCDGVNASAGEEATDEDEDEGFGVIAIDNERLIVAPGAWAVVKFVARLPDGLPANLHLLAKPRIGTERFTLNIITAPDAQGAGVRHGAGRRRSRPRKKRS
jgi:hypothetical protein